MILSTTSNLQTHQITRYLGIVSGKEIVYSTASSMKEVLDSFKDIMGLKKHKDSLEYAQTSAMEELKAQAESLGADAVVGISLDVEFYGGPVMVIVTGTAVKL
ncbi:MAG: YbjQ family protein [Saprospiraceae bacterium]|nr:YbjQ family protein [Saprospiraceae bacterium]